MELHLPRINTPRLSPTGSYKKESLMNKFSHFSQQTQSALQLPSISQTSSPRGDQTKPLNTQTLRNPFKPRFTLSPQHQIPQKLPWKHVISGTPNGIVKAYGVSSYKGQVRNYNEDRVCIVKNLKSYVNKNTSSWPNSQFYAIFDGHGGSGCSNFLRDNLYKFVIEDENFPQEPRKALRSGFLSAENYFLKHYPDDTSGSCAIVCLIVDNQIYIANTGDSRAVLYNSESNFTPLSIDHKPESEQQRIIDNGGQVSRSKHKINGIEHFYGPLRVYPGGLSVSRTIGDRDAKLESFGGMSNVVIPTPEITAFRLNQLNKAIMLGCDGIFDVLDNKEIGQEIFKKFNCRGTQHSICGAAADQLLLKSMKKGSTDNVTSIIILLQDLH